MSDIFNVLLFQNTLRTATPVVLAALGCLMTQHVNITNIGIDGMMLIGAFFAVLGSYYCGSWAAGLAFAIVFGVILGLLYYVLVIRFHSDEFIIGVALNIFAGGLTTFLLRTIFQVKGSFSDPRIVPLPTITIPGVKDIPVLGHLLSGNTLLVYVRLDLGAGLLVSDLQDPVGVPPAGQRRISRCAGGQRPKPRKDETQRQRALRRTELHGGRAPVAGLPDHVLREYVGLPRVCGLRLCDFRPGQSAHRISGSAAVRLYRSTGTAAAEVRPQRPDRHGPLSGHGHYDGGCGAVGAKKEKQSGQSRRIRKKPPLRSGKGRGGGKVVFRVHSKSAEFGNGNLAGSPFPRSGHSAG